MEQKIRDAGLNHKFNENWNLVVSLTLAPPTYTEGLAFSICVINIPLFIPSFHGMEKCVQVEGPLCPMRDTPLSLGEAESRNGASGGKSWGDC